ncbi:hypothetical protein [Burkholderia gladioli]|uniref:hypothetical protein n=1 Tax=Burkholderia gladioli TaxID=28095 RepID=UPI001641C248|nr:hypothetical protein [Burkholderia gladioli]
MGQPFFVRHICSSSRDPRFLQYDLAEQKARQDLKQAIAAHDTHRAQVLQAGIDDITKKRNALDIAQRPQAQRQLQEQRQRFIETMHNAPPMSNVDAGAYARSRAPVQGGDDREEIKRRALEQQQQFDDMVRRKHGQSSALLTDITNQRSLRNFHQIGAPARAVPNAIRPQPLQHQPTLQTKRVSVYCSIRVTTDTNSKP